MMMRNNPVAATLLGLLLASAIFTTVLTYRYVDSLRKLRGLQGSVLQINNSRNIIQALANETLEYSKKNPSIEPLLQSIGLKPAPSSPAAGPAKPGAK